MEQTYENCFVCGEKNPIGLKLTFNYHGNLASTTFKLPALYEGYNDIIHGGIIASILDETMAKAILHKNIKAFTVNLNIDYKKPLKPNHPYVAEGTICIIKRKTITAAASIFDGNTVYAFAKAKFFIIENLND